MLRVVVEPSSGDVSAASGSNRFVVWQDSSDTGPGDIYFKRSTDNGATWKSPVNLSSNSGKSYDPDIAVSGTNVYLTRTQANAGDTSSISFSEEVLTAELHGLPQMI